MALRRDPFTLPTRADRASVRESERPTLLVVVDTEEEFDWNAPFDRRNTSVEHMRSIGLLQTVFDEAGVVPLYVVDHPIATQSTSSAPLRAIAQDKRCEIGAHLHPWVSPPFEEEVCARNSYPGNLPAELERAKIESLASAIESNLGVRPRAYKSGRYGAGPNTPRILEELGFDIDLSPCPPFDFGADGGPDWSRFPCEPFWIGPTRRVLSIPNTGAYVGFVKDGAHGLYRLATHPSIAWAHIPGILSRLGAVERLFLSPEGYSFDDLRRLTIALRDRGVATFTFTLHSPSIQPGCTMYVRSQRERDLFLDTCRRYFRYFAEELGGVLRTASEVHRLAQAEKKKDRRVKVLGISPLDKDATASVVVDGRVVFAAGEERFSRVKQHAGFPRRAIQAALEWTGTSPGEIDAVAYAFLPADRETDLIQTALEAEAQFSREFVAPDLQELLRAAEARVPRRTQPVHGLREPNQRMRKGPLKEIFYRLAGGQRGISRAVALRASAEWGQRASADHHRWQAELEAGLSEFGLLAKLKRGEHHLSHSANAYLASGFERALVVTLDGYGSGLAGSISIGEGGRIRRLHNLRFPHSLGTMYEMVTSALGFHPDRHAGKIVGLAAFGDPQVLSDVLLGRVRRTPGDFQLVENLNVRFAQHLAARFPMIDVAAAYQRVLEVLATELVRHWLAQTGLTHVVLSGGVTANVKMNQRIHELDEVEATFVYPNMGDGGCGSGLAMLQSWPGGVKDSIHDAYLGPSYTPAEIEAELRRADVRFERPDDLTGEVARRIHAGEVIGRFDGRMEYGPRALGNRTILYHAREPEVNQWLNQRLGRTEFMPFAPVTLWEARERCYVNLAGAEHAAEFMTMTFDCTPFMRAQCPAAVHVDGTARPQLIRREVNPGYYDILRAYEKLSGIPSLINTSFNMHEEPIVCSPSDAIRAFVLGRLDGLAIGPYFASHPGTEARTRTSVPG